jgi:hypothetical protein
MLNSMSIDTKNMLKQVENDIWSKAIDSIVYDIIVKFDNRIFFDIEDALRDCYEEH